LSIYVVCLEGVSDVEEQSALAIHQRDTMAAHGIKGKMPIQISPTFPIAPSHMSINEVHPRASPEIYFFA
jgi:hypothetical protein